MKPFPLPCNYPGVKPKVPNNGVPPWGRKKVEFLFAIVGKRCQSGKARNNASRGVRPLPPAGHLSGAPSVQLSRSAFPPPADALLTLAGELRGWG